MANDPNSKRSIQFSLWHLLLVTTVWAIILTFLSSLDHSPLFRVFLGIYLLVVLTWCILFTYPYLQRMKIRRRKLREKLAEEYQQAKDNTSASDE